jgi:Domain of unknown function (DUF4333)
LTPSDDSPRMQTKLLALATALFAVTCVAACGAGVQDLDSVTVERAIAKSILRERGLYAAVACPSKVVQKAGHAFTCTARLGIGSYPLSVTETDGSGTVRYQNANPLVVLNIAKVQHAIEASVLSQRHLHATVSCPAEVLQRAGLVFRCTAVVDGESRRYPFVVREVDNAGHVRYLAT